MNRLGNIGERTTAGSGCSRTPAIADVRHDGYGKRIDVGVAGGRLDYEVEGEHSGGLRFEKIGLGWYISGEQIAFTPMIGNSARHAEQQIAEGWRGADAARAVSATALGGNFATTLGPLDPDARNNLRIKTHFALAPIKLRAFGIDGIEPGRLASVVTVAALFDAAGPAIAAGAEVVGRDPATTTGRLVQAKMLPCVGLLRMLKNAAELANSGDGSNKASAIVALDLSLSGLLDPKRLASPQLAPALARWMRDNRMRAVIQTCVTRLVPCIDTGQTKIAATSFDIERRDDAQPIAQREGVSHGSGGPYLLHVREKLAAQELGVSGRDGLAQIAKCHPVNPHGGGGGALVAILPDIAGGASTGLGGTATRMSAIDADDRRAAMIAGRCFHPHVAFEKAVALQFIAVIAQAEHGAAEHDRITHSPARSFDIFDDIGQASSRHDFAKLVDLLGLADRAGSVAERAISLTMRRSMESVSPGQVHRQGVGLDESERVARLRIDIDADDFEAGAEIAHSGSTRAAAQVEEDGTAQPIAAIANRIVERVRHGLGLPIRNEASGDGWFNPTLIIGVAMAADDLAAGCASVDVVGRGDYSATGRVHALPMAMAGANAAIPPAPINRLQLREVVGHLRLHQLVDMRDHGVGERPKARREIAARIPPTVYLVEEEARRAELIDSHAVDRIELAHGQFGRRIPFLRRASIDANRQIPSFPLMRHYAATPVLAVGRVGAQK